VVMDDPPERGVSAFVHFHGCVVVGFAPRRSM
jgi:hypothetical protein